MIHVATALLLLAGPAQSAEDQSSPPVQPAARQNAPRRALLPGETLQSAEAPGAKVFFFPTPLVPGLVEALQNGNENVRFTHILWPFARLETSAPFTFEGQRLSPGNYAMILVPSRGGQPMQLEVRRVPPGEFLTPGTMNVPDGETIVRLPDRSSPASSVAEAFTVRARPRPGGGVVLTFHYGEWQAVKELLP